ncbi:MAG: transglycosylase SLT domain-containing protein, partial [Candidatus Pacebacteria bacterium]|nr:transglycosylase SLT domain-containing protein [Candidatus Paceibacterota bacterium]
LLKSDLQVESTGSIGAIEKVDVTFTQGISVASGPLIPSQNSLSSYPYAEGVVNTALLSSGISSGGGNCKKGPNGINTSGSKIKPRNIPNLNWSAYALDLIKKSRLPQTRPTDAGSYFVGGQVSAEGWLLILGGMIECESSFNPNTTYQEPGGSKGPGTLSVGLLQMSKEDPEASRKGYSSNDLKDPYKNLEVGIGRLESLIVRDNCITCWNGPAGWRGGSAYWSVLRN